MSKFKSHDLRKNLQNYFWILIGIATSHVKRLDICIVKLHATFIDGWWLAKSLITQLTYFLVFLIETSTIQIIPPPTMEL